MRALRPYFVLWLKTTKTSVCLCCGRRLDDERDAFHHFINIASVSSAFSRLLRWSSVGLLVVSRRLDLVPLTRTTCTAFSSSWASRRTTSTACISVILFFDGFYASFATLASSRILSTAFQLVQTTCVAFLPSWATSQSTLYGSHVGGPDFLWKEHLFCIYGTVEIFVSSLQLTAESSQRQLAEGLRRHHRPRN